MKKAKKRVVKKKKRTKTFTLKDYSEKVLKPLAEKFNIENPLWQGNQSFTPAPLCLCGQLEDAILLLETRISNSIAKINSLM